MAAAVCLLFVGVANAGTMENAKIALHLQPHNTGKLDTCTLMSSPTCHSDSETSNLNLQGAVGVSYDAYIAVLDANSTSGVGGATFGLAYPASLGLFGNGLCADLEFPGQGWPATGGGNVITFDVITNCQNATNGAVDPTDVEGDNGMAVLYWLYVYAYGDATLAITQRNVAIPDFKIADCTAAEDSPLFPLYAGQLGFGTGIGYSPCVPPPVTPVEETTWGAIKSQFDGE